MIHGAAWTKNDVKEGRNAGIVSVAIVEGSSIMGLTEKEYETLPDAGML